MKTTQISSAALLFALATAGLISKSAGHVSQVANPDVGPSVPDEAKSKFADGSVDNLLYTPGVSSRDSVVPDNIFVVQCLGAGFRGDCLVFGAPPGHCVSYSSYNSNGTATSDKYNKEVNSLSTNTGGVCQFYHNEGCDVNGDDPGVTLSYAYDLSKDESGNTRPDDYDGSYHHNITSWRC